MKATASILVRAPVEKIIGFVTDPDGYPKADTKILKLTPLEQGEDWSRVRARGYLRWPFLQGAMTLYVQVRGTERVDIEAEPESFDMPTRLTVDSFVANFTFEPTGEGVIVSHTEDQRFKDTPLGRLAERLSSRWLADHLKREEMPRLKAILESTSA
jgi:hypothetical protein